MAKKLQILRGTTAQNDAYTGSIGELTMDTEKVEVRIHDGTTQGGKKIGSGGANLPILTHVFSDHIINDISWLRADTFSWQSGDVYVAAYEHLAEDFNNGTKTLISEGAGIWCYVAPDGHRIVDASDTTQVTNVENLYEATGVAWYYILDTINKQFKLPRTKWGFTGLRDSVGGYVAPGLPNITGKAGHTLAYTNMSGAFKRGEVKNFQTGSSGSYEAIFDASGSNSIYGNSDTVQPPATQMYLYFYVGNFEQTAVEQTAGITAETLNGKADTDLGNIPANYDYVVESQLPTSANGYTWYRKYKSGWVEQGGAIPLNTTSVSLPIEMAQENYLCVIAYRNTTSTSNIPFGSAYTNSQTTTGFTCVGSTGTYKSWQVAGYAA